MIESHESTTAKLCSFARAYHSTYARKKIFDDSLAFDFMGLEQYEETGQLIGHNYQENLIDPNLSFHSSEIVDKLNHYLMPIPISRIAFAEQELTSFAGRFPLCQYVICGAGMDTFIFRNDNNNIRIFEIDHPDTQRFKKARIHQLEWTIPENGAGAFAASGVVAADEGAVPPRRSILVGKPLDVVTHFEAAVGTVDKAGEDASDAVRRRRLADFLFVDADHGIPYLPGDDRLMGPFHPNPFLLRLVDELAGLIG